MLIAPFCKLLAAVDFYAVGGQSGSPCVVNQFLQPPLLPRSPSLRTTRKQDESTALLQSTAWNRLFYLTGLPVRCRQPRRLTSSAGLELPARLALPSQRSGVVGGTDHASHPPSRASASALTVASAGRPHRYAWACKDRASTRSVRRRSAWRYVAAKLAERSGRFPTDSLLHEYIRVGGTPRDPAFLHSGRVVLNIRNVCSRKRGYAEWKMRLPGGRQIDSRTGVTRTQLPGLAVLSAPPRSI